MELILAFFTALFSVVNPFGAMPVFVAMTEGYTKQARNRQALRASIFMAAILIVSFFAGTFILEFFGIRVEDLRTAGGLLIAKTGFGLLNANAHKGKPLGKDVTEEAIEKNDISFTPLAMPLLSGPGAIAVTIGFHGIAESYVENLYVVVAVVAVSLLAFVTLISSVKLTSYLGKSGMEALIRIMGFITLSIGVSMILNGIIGLVKLNFGL